MPDPRTLATGLAVTRLLFGARLVLQPAAADQSWVGAAIRTPAGAVMTRSQGARDVALGAGALRALRAGDGAEARRWFAAHLVADATDLAATLAAWNGLPVGRRIFAALMAGGSAAIAAMTVAGGS